MSGLDVAAGAAGLASLCVTLLQGCIQGIAIISATRAAHKEIDRLSFILEWEQSRLLKWAHKAGLSGDDTPSLKLNWSLIYELLKRLHTDLTDASVLRDKYNLVVDARDSDQLGPNGFAYPTTSSQAPQALQGDLFDILRARLGSKLRHRLDQILRRTAKESKRLTWVALDQEKAESLLTNISYYNNALQELLDDAHQDDLRSWMEILLRDLVTRSTNSTDLTTLQACMQRPTASNIPALEAALRIKQIRLLLALDGRRGEVRPSKEEIKASKLSKIACNHLKELVPVQSRPNWELAEYKSRSSSSPVHSYVLIEWKDAISQQASSLIKRRVTELAFLMSNLSVESFHSFRCLGYVEQPGPAGLRLAYVFEVCSLVNSVERVMRPRLMDLASAIQLHSVPSLTRRVRIALALAESILQIHTAGWLHKGIRTSNVIFLSEKIHSIDYDRDTSGPFLAGFEFTRHSLEETETMPMDSTQRLYEHSDRRIISNQHKPFKRQYDLHALGCVLIELFLWTSLPQVLDTMDDQKPSTASPAPNSNNPPKSANQIQHEATERVMSRKAVLDDLEPAWPIMDRIAAAAGDQVRRVVQLCLFPATSTDTTIAHDSPIPANEANEHDPPEDPDLTIDLQASIVQTLRSVHEHI